MSSSSITPTTPAVTCGPWESQPLSWQMETHLWLRCTQSKPSSKFQGESTGGRSKHTAEGSSGKDTDRFSLLFCEEDNNKSECDSEGDGRKNDSRCTRNPPQHFIVTVPFFFFSFLHLFAMLKEASAE